MGVPAFPRMTVSPPATHSRPGTGAHWPQAC
jgi:hypothetical protein